MYVTEYVIYPLIFLIYLYYLFKLLLPNCICFTVCKGNLKIKFIDFDIKLRLGIDSKKYCTKSFKVF